MGIDVQQTTSTCIDEGVSFNAVFNGRCQNSDEDDAIRTGARAK